MSANWPAIDYGEWQPTLRTVHLWSQVLGKVALALAPLEPQWGNAALEVTPRGIATRPLPYNPGQGVTCERLTLELDFGGDRLLLASSLDRGDGLIAGAWPLADGLAVAQFYGFVVEALVQAGASVTLNPLAQEMPDPPMLDTYTGASTYDHDAIRRFHSALLLVANVFAEWRAGFRGRSTLVNFWWGSFDLALNRFSGRPADPPDGADIIFERAMDAEEFAIGFWPGDARYPRAAFYSYGHPKPDAIETATVAPAGAVWNDDLGEFVLDYDVLRASPDPAAALMAFAQSSYEAVATRLGWDIEALTYR